MIAVIGFTAVVAAISALSAVLDPSADRVRLTEARRELKRSGVSYEKGSAEEHRALAVLLEGGSLDQLA
ncbi:MAG TPA: hypothetical protein VKA32_01355 [Gammaproteobacteria bacterium]|nr:hypothetical protein [Gammaproteobacteria bacterium]